MVRQTAKTAILYVLTWALLGECGAFTFAIAGRVSSAIPYCYSKKPN
jgi:hypothetical protein